MYQYRKTGVQGIDHTGWFKIQLLRSDGKIVKVNRSRLDKLRREGRLVGDDDAAFDLTIKWIRELGA